MQSGSPPLFEIYNTVISMCHSRGFLVPPRCTVEEYAEKFCVLDEATNMLFVDRNLLTLSLIHNDREKTVRVFFLEPNGVKMGKKQLEEFLKKLGETRTRAIFIVPNGSEFTSHAKKIMDEANRESKNVLLESFSELQVSIDITVRNKQFTEYSLLTEIEATEIRKQKIACIAYNDVVARHFGMQHNDVLKCTRGSEPAGKYNNYRRCLYLEQLPKETKMKKKV